VILELLLSAAGAAVPDGLAASENWEQQLVLQVQHFRELPQATWLSKQNS
jgi:hypothetical protein